MTFTNYSVWLCTEEVKLMQYSNPVEEDSVQVQLAAVQELSRDY